MPGGEVPGRPALTISLVGMPGCGKSTVGRHLAHQLGLKFVDSDTEIERRIGQPIRDYFAQHGEDAFRDVEQEVIEHLSGQPGSHWPQVAAALRRPFRSDKHLTCGKLCPIKTLHSAETLMSTTLESLQAEVLRLPPKDKARLLDRLIASLDADTEAEAAWDAVADHREGEIEAGAVQPVPLAVAIARLDARFPG